MYEILAKGGPLVIPIAITSIVALGVFIERLWSLQPVRIIPSTFITRIEGLVKEGRVNDALLLCQEHKTPMANIMAAALKHADKGHRRIKESMEDVGRLEATFLERHIEIIGTCSAIAPLMGLLGTVSGMIGVFQGVVDHGLGDPAFFATGIWEALITTAVGLGVAIPAFIFYKYLQAHVDSLLAEMEERSLEMADLLSKD